MRRARWAYLLDEDPDFRRWFENLARGSRVTAFENARVLYRFLRQHDMTPREFADLAKKDRRKVEDILMDFVARLHREGKAPNYIGNYPKAVRSWLNHNEVRLVRRIKIGNTNVTPTIADERVPTMDELRTILCYPKARARCSIALMAFSGLRPETLGNMRGTDGLAVKDLPEIKMDGGDVAFTKAPTMVAVRPNLSKAKQKYFTFLTSEGCEYLKAYLEMRLSGGEELTPESAIIAVTPGYENTVYRNNETSFITTKNVTREIREAMRPRFKWRPYVLRAYFDTQLLVAENHGKISHAYRQFFMGHKGDIEARYTTHKGRLPDHLVEDMRESFEKCEEYLSTIQRKAVVDLEMATIESLFAYGKLQGVPEEEINVMRQAVMKLKTPTADKVIELLSGSADLGVSFKIRKKPGPETVSSKTTLETTKETMQNSDRPFEARIVDETELTEFLEMGFDMVATTSDGKFVVRRQNHLT